LISLPRYECAILQNKLKGTPVVPLFVAGAEKDANGNIVFKPFDFQEMDPASFPHTPHARGSDVQFTVDTMR
jgi:hypothetical protein